MAQGERLDGAAPSGPAAAAPGLERRGFLRVPAYGVSILVETAEGQRPARVCDVSRSGLRIALDAPPPPLGGRVRLLHGQAGELVGTCVRHGHGEVGIALEAASSEIERALQCLALLLAEQDRPTADPAASA